MLFPANCSEVWISWAICPKKDGGGIFLLSCQNLPFLRVFLESIKNDFWPEKWRISFILFYNRIFVVLNPSEKHRGKRCFLILSLLSHNLPGTLIFSQKRVSKASNLIACCFWCFKITLLMLYYMAKASKVLKLKDIWMFSSVIV